MPEMEARDSKESAFASALREAWAPIVDRVKAGREPNWDDFAERTAKASREHIESAQRLAAVVLWLLFMDDLKSIDLSGVDGSLRGKLPSGKEIGSSIEYNGRDADLGREVAKTSRERWKALPDDPSTEDLDRWASTNFGADRAGNIAATELTSAQSYGEAAAREIIENRGLDLVAYWKAEDGACEVCRPLDGKPESVWALVFPAGPPSPHPSCRCSLRYIRQAK